LGCGMGWAAITNARRGNWGLQASIIPRPAYAAARSGLFHPHPHPHAHMLLSQVSIDAVALSHSQSLRAAAQYSRTAASGAEAGGRSWEAELDDLMLMEAIRQSLAGQPGGASVAAPPGSGGAASWDLGVAAGSGGGVCAPDEAGGGGSSASAAEDEMADAITARLAEHVERSVRAQLARGRSSGPGTSTGAMPDVLLLPPAMADAAEEAAPDLAGRGTSGRLGGCRYRMSLQRRVSGVTTLTRWETGRTAARSPRPSSGPSPTISAQPARPAVRDRHHWLALGALGVRLLLQMTRRSSRAVCLRNGAAPMRPRRRHSSGRLQPPARTPRRRRSTLATLPPGLRVKEARRSLIEHSACLSRWNHRWMTTSHLLPTPESTAGRRAAGSRVSPHHSPLLHRRKPRRRRVMASGVGLGQQ